MRYYYYYSSGEKQGPFSAKEIKQQAKEGWILPSTVIESEIDGKQFRAKKITGIEFGEPGIEFVISPVIDPVMLESSSRHQFSPPEPMDESQDNPSSVQPSFDTPESSVTETSLYYYDANGIKQGPIDYKKLKILALHGIIKKDTLLETEAGNLIPASEFANGLSFQEKLVNSSQTQTVLPEEAEPQVLAVIKGSTVWDTVLALVIFFIGLPMLAFFLLFVSCRA